MKYSKAVMTKYIGPTNTKGARVKASDDNENSITINWDSELNLEKNHTAAAITLLKKIESKSVISSVAYSEMTIDAIAPLKDGYIFTATRKNFVKIGD